MTGTNLGHQIRTFRVRRCLTQSEVALTAAVSYRTISDLERGRVRRPHPATLRAIARALALTPAELETLSRCAYESGIVTHTAAARSSMAPSSQYCPAAENRPSPRQPSHITAGDQAKQAAPTIGAISPDAPQANPNAPA